MAGDDEAVPGGLDEPWKRLRWARERKYPSKVAAAKAMGMPEPTYYGHENGNTPFPRDQAIRYATFFRVNLEWLLTGKGTPLGGSSPIQDIFDSLPDHKKPAAMDFLEYLKNSGG